ncbi:MAG: hypothetical protein V7698_16860, partial [Paracoccaceae bacterium]
DPKSIIRGGSVRDGKNGSVLGGNQHHSLMLFSGGSRDSWNLRPDRPAAYHALTFELDHSMGTDQRAMARDIVASADVL